MTTPATIPATLTMSVTESFDLSFDTTVDLAACGGTAPVGPTSTLRNISTGEIVAPANAPTVDGTNIIQRIVGPTDLVTPGSYRLAVNFTASPTDNVWSMQLVISAAR